MEKITERVTVQTEAIADTIDKLRGEFEDELRYLELDLSSWSAEDVVRVNMTKPALGQFTDLKSTLSEYQAIRPQASSRSEELVRAPERETFEKAIIGLVEAWDEMMAVAETPVDDMTPDGRFAPAKDDVDQSRSSDANRVERHDHRLLEPELDLLRKDNETLVSENDQLKQDRSDLQEDKTKLGEQVSRLRDELSQRPRDAGALA